MSIGVFIDDPIQSVTEFVFHWSSTSEVSLASDTLHLIPGWQPPAFAGGVCDLLDPYGLCVGMYDPSGVGAPLSSLQVATLVFNVIGGGSGEAVIGPLFAPVDRILSGGFNVASSFSLNSATVRVVPEPSPVALIGLGLVGMARARRRRRPRGPRPQAAAFAAGRAFRAGSRRHPAPARRASRG